MNSDGERAQALRQWRTAHPSREFDTSTVAGIRKAERFKARLEDQGFSVTTVPRGFEKVRISGAPSEGK